MKNKLLYLFTRTPLHVGAGSSVGAIDQPIQRERHTGFPIIPGSSIKGVLRHAATNSSTLSEHEVDDLFGPEDSNSKKSMKITRSGDVSFGEAKILAFPVRSARGSFAYVTCPQILTRFARESNIQDLPDLPSPEEQSCFAASAVTFADKKAVVLEEYKFTHEGPFPNEWVSAIRDLVDDPVWKLAPERLVLLSDGDFSHAVSTMTEISHHTKIDAATGTVAKGALFNLESIPAESLFMATANIIGHSKSHAQRDPSSDQQEIYTTDTTASLNKLLAAHPLIQLGGNSTTGRGFCTLTSA